MTKKKQTEFDAIIVGAGPAGSTIAIMLAKAGMSVGLIDRAKFPRRKPCTGWVNANVAKLLDDLGVASKQLLARPIQDVAFHNADLSKTAVPKLGSLPGYLIDRAAFDERLVNTAKRAGAQLIENREVTDLDAEESGVNVITSDGSKFHCRLLVLAIGASKKLRAKVGIARSDMRETRWTALIEHALEGKSKDPSTTSRIDIVLGATFENGLGVLARQKDRVSLTLNSPGERAAIADQILTLAHMMREKKMVTPDFPIEPAAVECAESSFGPALELDSHVGKHTLLIGDAGGFIAAVSQEGIYPSMWSAQIAAEVVGAAWGADISQDALMTFDNKWRLAMGDYLRPPNTDLQLLAPLIFSNQPMTDRMASAFFFGENI
jgi:geranylgeranyl reductase family protein